MATHDSHQFFQRSTRKPHLFHSFGKLHLMLIATLVVLPQLLSAQWNATVGAQSHDLGRQGLAFLPNEIWIHAGDSITWTVTADEPHTVTFLTDGQIRPPLPWAARDSPRAPRSSTDPPASRAHFCSKVRSLP
jgi:plastocyanin